MHTSRISLIRLDHHIPRSLNATCKSRQNLPVCNFSWRRILIEITATPQQCVIRQIAAGNPDSPFFAFDLSWFCGSDQAFRAHATQTSGLGCSLSSPRPPPTSLDSLQLRADSRNHTAQTMWMRCGCSWRCSCSCARASLASALCSSI